MNAIVRDALESIRQNKYLQDRVEQMIADKKEKDLFIMALCACNFGGKIRLISDTVVSDFAEAIKNELVPA